MHTDKYNAAHQAKSIWTIFRNNLPSASYQTTI